MVPGKFAVFARNPVRLLKSVVLPAFGLPTSATHVSSAAVPLRPERLDIWMVEMIDPHLGDCHARPKKHQKHHRRIESP